MSITRVAKIAGVGIGTVSRYINDRSKVSDETASRIAAAFDECGYSPQLRAQKKKIKETEVAKTGVIVFLSIGDIIPQKMFTMPVFSMFLNNMQAVLSSHGMNLMLANASETGKIPSILNKKYCDGVIVQSLSGNDISPQMYEVLHALPTVWCFREHCSYSHEFDHVLYNNSLVGPLAARYMKEHGHRQVLFINSNNKHAAFRQRQELFLKSCHELGIEATAIESQYPAHYSTAAHCFSITRQLMEQQNNFTGAFFCSDDIMLGVYNELRAKMFDISAINMLGCNNEEQFLRYIQPSPDSIDIRISEVCKISVQQLLKRINEPGLPSVELLIPPRINYADNTNGDKDESFLST